jgi:hypothetical protein
LERCALKYYFCWNTVRGYFWKTMKDKALELSLAALLLKTIAVEGDGRG